MCTSPKVDNSVQKQQQEEAAQARAEEEARQARIKQGMTTLDDTFSRFNDGYYGARKEAYTDFYQPQLDDQFKTAKDQLTFALARSGNINSSVAGDKQGELQKKYDTQLATINSQADADVASQQAKIDSEKSSLVSQLNATGNADAVSNQALSRTQQLYSETPSYNPLGDIFAGVASGIGNYANASANNSALASYFGNSGSKSSGYYTVK